MGWKMVEYICPFGHTWESLENTPPPSMQVCACGSQGSLQISAPAVIAHEPVTVTRREGTRDEERPPKVMDTRYLARRHGIDV